MAEPERPLDKPLQDTLKEIEKRHSERQRKSWTCRECNTEQKPPPAPNDTCAKCSESAVALAIDKRFGQIDTLMKGFGIPTTLCIHTQPLQGMEWALPYAATNRGLFLSGPSGVGKSVAAVLIARRWLELWATEAVVTQKDATTAWRFVSCAALVMKLQDLWRSDEDSAFKHLQGVATVPHLILDDLGTEKASDYVKQAMYYLINEREAWGRQTIITSNYDLVRIEAQYDSRIGSRIMGMCDARDLRGRDRRAPTS